MTVDADMACYLSCGHFGMSVVEPHPIGDDPLYQRQRLT